MNWSFRATLIPTLLLMLVAWSASGLAQNNPGAWPAGLPQPYQARYALYRDNKLAGHGEMALRALGNNQYQSSSVSKATKGFAGFLGGEVRETSTWELTAQGPRALHYRYDQKVAFSKRNRESHFDHASGRVTGTHKGEDWDLRLRDGAMDRLLTNLLMIGEIAQGEQAMSYLVAERGRYKEYDYRVTGREQIDTPLGPLDTIRVERIHSDPARQTISWHAPAQHYLPMRIVHVDDGEELRLEVETVTPL